MTALKAEIEVHGRIADIGRDAWDRCATSSHHAFNPFVAFDFLDILEEFGCAVGAHRLGSAPPERQRRGRLRGGGRSRLRQVS